MPIRYLLLMMGFMAVYCGFIYNEWFSMPVQFFESCYDVEQRRQHKPMIIPDRDEDKPLTAKDIKGDWYYPRKSIECNYPAGYDHVWGLTSNGLSYTNSIKMKLSVIFAILHMSIGILVKGSNSIYFRKWAVLIFEVIIGLIILLFLFGWMDALIFAKWFHPLYIDDETPSNKQVGYLTEEQREEDKDYEYQGEVDNQNMPSIISIMIATVFKLGHRTPEEDEKTTLIG